MTTFTSQLRNVSRALVLTALFLHNIASANTIHAPAKPNELINSTLKSAGEPDYPPLSVVNPDGTAGGFSIELLTAAIQAVGLDVTYRVGPWHEIKTELAQGELDVLPLVGRTPEREKQYDFTFTYFTMHGAVFVRKNDSRLQTRADLKNLHIAVMEGDNAHEYITRNHLSPRVTTTKTFDEAFRGLADKQWDAVVAQQLMGLRLTNVLGLDSVESRLTLLDFTQEFSFAVKDGNVALLAKLNEGLAIVLSDGTFHRLQEKWITPIEKPSLFQRILLPLAGFAVFLLLTMASVLLWNHSLRRLVRKRTQQLETLNAILQAHRDSLEHTVSERTRENLTMQQQVFRSTQLASLGQLAAGVAHEINNPLMIISGYIELIEIALTNKLNVDSAKIMLDKISQSIDRITSIIGRLNTLGRTDKEEQCAVNLVVIIHELVSFLSPIYAKANVEISISATDVSEAWVTGNKGKIYQVLLNLIKNARDALVDHGGGTITVGLSKNQETWTMEVKDTGPGIAPEHVPSLFIPFSTTKPVGSGMGLGLSIAHSLVTEMGGTIAVTPKLADGGASFSVTFSSISHPAAEENRNHIHEREPSPKHLKVLVIDDEPMVCEVIVAYLEQLGIKAESISDPTEALKQLATRRVDLLLTDVLMPKMNACQLVQAADSQNLLTETKIIALTGGIISTYPPDIRNFLESRAAKVLAKPLTINDLASCIQALYGQSAELTTKCS